MIKYYCIISFILSIFIISCSYTSKKNIALKEQIYIKDSLNKDISYKLDSLIILKDSLKIVISDLQEKQFISNYKLERIEYYTDIAAKDNNLKYLRGWIYRTLND